MQMNTPHIKKTQTHGQKILKLTNTQEQVQVNIDSMFIIMRPGAKSPYVFWTPMWTHAVPLGFALALHCSALV